MIHQIYYKESQQDWLFDDSKHFFNAEIHPALENRVILKVEPKYHTGVLSWRFKQKHPKAINSLQLISMVEDNDVISFFAKNKCKNQVNFMSHNLNIDFLPLLEVLLFGTGLFKEVEKPNKGVIYQNAFIAKEEVFKKYQSVLRIVFENVPMIWDKLMQPTKYNGDKEFIKRLNWEYHLNLKTYPVMPFVFEMIPSLFVQYYDLKFKNVW